MSRRSNCFLAGVEGDPDDVVVVVVPISAKIFLGDFLGLARSLSSAGLLLLALD